MGFWDAVGNVAKGAMNKIEGFNNEVNIHVDELQGMPSDKLKRIVKSGGDTAKRIAAGKILKERGEI